MADTVTSTDIIDGERYYIVQLTNESDGTGESDVTKVDVSSLSPVPADSRVTIEEIWYATQGMAVELHWNATANVLAYAVPQDEIGHVDFGPVGGLRNNAGAGVNGDILLSTIGHAAGDGYHIVLKCRKQ